MIFVKISEAEQHLWDVNPRRFYYRKKTAEIAIIVSSIGNHDGDYGVAVNPVSAAIIIADKTDVRRSRVRDKIIELFDVHDRVNYSVVRSDLEIDNQI